MKMQLVMRYTYATALTCLVLIYHWTDLSPFIFPLPAPTNITILFWTRYYEEPILLLIPLDMVTFENETQRSIYCKRKAINCHFSTVRRDINTSDAVIIHLRDIFLEIKRKTWAGMPSYRKETQPWIFFARESPVNTLMNLSLYPNVFNWTMTYRSDSDIPFPYGKVVRTSSTKLREEESRNQMYHSNHSNARHILRSFNKTKPIAWTVSNCKPKNKRDKLVNQLRKFIPVDVYGLCGNLKCSNSSVLNPNVDGCHTELQKTYKFSLAFENSLCDEYVTEKFFNALKYWMVPVVYGSVDYDKIGPPHSFINVKDFSSIEELGKTLKRLAANQAEYEKYFEWKGHFEVASTDHDVWCDLCEKVYDGKESGWKVRKWYSDIHSWFFSAAATNSSSSSSSSEFITVTDVTDINSKKDSTGKTNIPKNFTAACTQPPFNLSII